MMHFRLRLGVLLAGLLACGEPTGNTTPGPPAQLFALPAGQLGRPGAATPVAPSLLVVDAEGRPVPDAPVTFTVVGGGGSVSATETHTNHDGVATAGSWTLGPAPGPQSLRASTADLTQDIPAIASDGEALYLFEIAAGAAHTCATAAVSQYSYPLLLCWGRNTFGQLGTGEARPFRETPVVVRANPKQFGFGASTLSLGRDHTCVLDTDENSSAVRSIRCWGSNLSGQLGVAEPSARAVRLPGSAWALAAGSLHGCAIAVDSDALNCWGANESGQLGDGSVTGREFGAATAAVPHTQGQLARISAGNGFSCALVRLNTIAIATVYCWGRNDSGQLGDGTTVSHASPVPVAIQFAESQNYPLLFSGPSHSCVIKAAVPRFGVGSGQQAVGPVYCWGRNDFGQLGDGTTIDRSTPVLAANGAEFSELAVGGSHTCGIAGGAVYCWGSNSDGQLGGGSFGGSASTPVRAASSTFFAHLTAGERHTCALNGSRVAYCWGLNAEGQLGDGTTTSRSVPTAVGPYYP